MKVLMIDVGGTHVKLMLESDGEVRKFDSHPKMTAREMVQQTLAGMGGWHPDRVSIGYPGILRRGRPAIEPRNLGDGWVGFDYAAAFGLPVRMINDAAMQALGNYDRGRLFFMGLGTSTGACLVADDMVVPLEIGLLRLNAQETLRDRLSDEGLERLGRENWLKALYEGVAMLQDAFYPDLTVLGGGNSKLVDPLPQNCRRVANFTAYRGAVRLWEEADMTAVPIETTWRIVRHRA
jgi:polyphosphate glucokinase